MKSSVASGYLVQTKVKGASMSLKMTASSFSDAGSQQTMLVRMKRSPALKTRQTELIAFKRTTKTTTFEGKIIVDKKPSVAESGSYKSAKKTTTTASKV